MSTVSVPTSVSVSTLDHGADLSRARAIPVSRASSRRASRREYLFVWAIAFPIFMMIAFFAQLLPQARRRRLLGACADGNIIAQAKAMAAMSIPFAFMG